MFNTFLPAALRAAQICRYLVYSEADFEVFRHVAPMGVKFGHPSEFQRVSRLGSVTCKAL